MNVEQRPSAMDVDVSGRVVSDDDVAMTPVDQANELQLVVQDDDPSIKTLKKRATTKLKRKEKREKRKSKCEELVISQPDYDSFRSMADVIRDPQERVSMFGARPTTESAGAQTGRVKRMLSIIGIGHQRKDALRGSNREQWELIDPEALRRAPIPESLIIHPPTVAFAVGPDASAGGGSSSEPVERRLTAPPLPMTLVPRPPPPTPSSAHDAQNPPPLPPIPLGLIRPKPAPNQRRAQTMPTSAAGDMGTTTSTTTVVTSDKELHGGGAHPQHEQSQQQQPNGGDGAGAEEMDSEEAIVLCLATYTFKAQQPTELSFQEGDVIEVLSRKKIDWWTGRLNGQCGLFPRIFVTNYSPQTDEASDGLDASGDYDEEEDGLRTPTSPPPRVHCSSPLSSPPPSLIFGAAPPPPCEPPLDEVWEELRSHSAAMHAAPPMTAIAAEPSLPMTEQIPLERSDSSEEPLPAAPSSPPASTSPNTSPPPSQIAGVMTPYSTDSSPMSSSETSPSSSLSDLSSLIAAPLAQHQPRKAVSASPSFASLTARSCPLPPPTSTSASAPTLPALEPSSASSTAYPPSSPALSLSPASSATASQSSSATTSPAATPSTSTTPSPDSSPRDRHTPVIVDVPSAPPSSPAKPAVSPSPSGGPGLRPSGLSASSTSASASTTALLGISKVAALSQSFSAAAALSAQSTSPSSASPTASSSLVQERRKMLFGASASPPGGGNGGGASSPIRSSVGASSVPNFSQSFAALPSPPAVKAGAPTSISLKALPPLVPSKVGRPTSPHSFAATAKTIGHSAVGSSKHSPRAAIPWGPSQPVGGPHSSPLQSPAASHAAVPAPTNSTSPLSATAQPTMRKFKEGAPIILSRRKDATQQTSANAPSTGPRALSSSEPEGGTRGRRISDPPPVLSSDLEATPTAALKGAQSPTAGGAEAEPTTPPARPTNPALSRSAATMRPTTGGRGRGKVRTRTPQPLGGAKPKPDATTIEPAATAAAATTTTTDHAASPAPAVELTVSSE